MSPATVSEATRCVCGHDWGQHGPATDGRQPCLSYVLARRAQQPRGRQHGGVQADRGVGLLSLSVLCPCGDFKPADDRDQLDGLALDREVDQRLGR